eukprot:TRINITY_DN1770_c0_g1_i2.p1 TRINITY_DN1770_c0_g1~~TRINITY_DN1770_c0_g1_i2.p1  ORF type:complete len:192 (+),score=22.05 TRINITY_DN1770_c0_g1_i2:292-867(+)
MDGNEFFVQIDRSYLEDDFNMYGLNQNIPHYDSALDHILDRAEFTGSESKILEIKRAAEKLYGLSHARFILTTRGLDMMYDKFQSGEFGRCPRAYCENQYVLPMGESDFVKTCKLRLYCPRCEDIYVPPPKYAKIDGSYFGPTFPHMMIQVYPDVIPTKPKTTYVPRIFGFKIHSSSREALIRHRTQEKKN